MIDHQGNDFGTIITAAVVSILCSLAAAMPEMPPIPPAIDGSILNDTQMRFACIAGALGGAILSVLIFPPQRITRRNIAAKFFASGVSGVLFAPLVLRWLSLARDFDVVLGISAVVALIAIGVLRVAVPAWERIAGRKLTLEDEDQNTKDGGTQ